MNFRTGFLVNAMESDVIEYDAWRVAKNYMQSWFVLDVASGIPFGLIELIFATGSSTSVRERYVIACVSIRERECVCECVCGLCSSYILKIEMRERERERGGICFCILVFFCHYFILVFFKYM
jgi:hypothetical protein